MIDAKLQAIVNRAPKLYRGRYLSTLRGKVTPRTAIKVKCRECCGWQRMESGIDKIGDCRVFGCPLWAFRPYQGKKGLPAAQTAPDEV